MRALTGTAATVEYVVAAASEVAGWSEQFGGLDRLVPESVRAAAARHHRPEDDLAYRGAHAVFRLMAARQLGIRPSAAASLPVTRRCLVCGSDAHGKPSVAGVELSLSRSAGMIMVAAAPQGNPIGADIELIPPVLFDGFDSYALSPAEVNALAADDVVSRLSLWVAKEAVLKATGHGLSVEPSTLKITADSCSGLHGVEHLRLTSIDAPQGYLAAIAAPAGAGVELLKLRDLL